MIENLLILTLLAGIIGVSFAICTARKNGVRPASVVLMPNNAARKGGAADRQMPPSKKKYKENGRGHGRARSFFICRTKGEDRAPIIRQNVVFGAINFMLGAGNDD